MLHQRAASSRTRKFVRGGLFLLLQCSWALPTEAGAAPRLQVGSVQAQPGWVVELPVTLATAGAPVAAVSQNLFFDPRNTPIVQRAPGEPDCWVEPSTGKQGFFAFWPDGCWQWPETCDMVSAVILSFQSTQPIPDGRLFTCRVKVSPNAAAGEYAVASDYADAASPDASELALEHFGGAIQVVNPSGGGGGGCSIATRGDGSWLLLAALLWFGWRHKGRAKSYRRWRWALVALALSLPALVLFRAKAQVSPASPPTTRVLEIGGSLRPAGLEGSGTFQGEIALFSNGGISGSVEVEVGGRKETLNISAALSGGRIRGGRAWAPHGRIRAVLAGQVSAEAGGSLRKPSGSLRWRDGSRYLWELEEIRVLGKQAAREVVEALGRGERPTVALYLDTYPVDREIRLRFRDKTSPAWVRAADREAAFKLKRSLSSAFRAQVINELGKLGVTVPSVSSTETVRTHVPAVLESFQQLQAVLALPSIVAVQILPDERGFRIEPLLNESLPLIRQPEVAGRLRGGVSVAVLDTGLGFSEINGHFLFGEACRYGPGSPDCRVLFTKDFAVPPYPENISGDLPPFHGTYVAGIAGSIAPEAGLIGLRVIRDVLCNPCRDEQAFTRVFNALDWVLDYGAAFSVVAVNMSFQLFPTDGSSPLRSEPCTDFPDLTQRVRDLWQLGILPVAASGNSGTGGIVIPACVPGVVSVGAVYDATLTSQENPDCPGDASAADRVWCRSSTAPFLTLLAPGARIVWDAFAEAFGQAGPGSGTSAAAPHVAGAVAALRGRGGFENDPPGCTLSRLVRTGRPVPDHRTGETFARIDLAAAAATRPNSVGDCNEDGLVTVSEVSRGIRILLGQVGIAQCPALDANGDGTATIDEVVSAVNVRRYRCPLPPVMAV